jgi:uncharacterized membrane protein YgdD (TMEM256/DUF423 family)
MIGGYTLAAGLNGMAMVALAAYGAHGTGGAGLAQPALFLTAWQVHAVHTATLVGLGMCRRPNIWLHGAFWLMLGGTFFFCASLYGQGAGLFSEGSILTPLGGMMLIVGWCALAISGAYRMVTRAHSADVQSDSPMAPAPVRRRCVDPEPEGSDDADDDAADDPGTPLHGVGGSLPRDRSRYSYAGGRRQRY